VHHEIVGMGLLIKILQEKTCVAMVDVGEAVIGPCDGETEILIELLCQREVLGRNE
jgi:hypothetical protein